MASGSSLLSEEQLLCPICLDVFTQPVSTPCGHNFCMSCIKSYWDDVPACQCPVCKESFQRKPDLKVNTFISELASHFSSLQVTDAHIWSAEPQQVSSGGAVRCDVCTDDQKEAVKSCLECLTSYCEVHLEPHHRAAGLKRHTLVEPVASLEDRICKEHNRPLALFCKDDNVLLCDVCAMMRHTERDVVPVQQAYREVMDLLGDTEAEVQDVIQKRLQKVQNVKESVKQNKTETEEVIANSTRDLMELVSEIQRSQKEIGRVTEEKQKAAEEEADGLINGMEQEISELQRRTVELREMKQIKDRHHFLRRYIKSSLQPHAVGPSTLRFNEHTKIQQIHESLRKFVSQLQALLKKMNTEINVIADNADESYCGRLNYLRYMQQYEMDVVLDVTTAHPQLILSNDRKQVSFNTKGSRRNVFLTPKMFTHNLAVLGQTGFSSYKHYFEVFVGRKTEWCLGIATASIRRNGELNRNPRSGLWAIWFLENSFQTFDCAGVSVHEGRVKRVGVFVNHECGLVSFYDADTAKHIYSFTKCSFTEELYPYFNPCDNEYGSNLDPITIVPC
ncbi:E3 ubiquitin-protein ligase TRIM39-like [Brachyistius frenatus]|uniref:E3 ubiquitin-protein ligase TRIM39-like n=1 Tax=Brachyistius frenatus TaxID=100188 RepID=UPI0037E8F8C8